MADSQPDGERDTPDAPDQTIHLPALISDEFGVARSVARMAIAEGNVEIDGEKKGALFDVKRSEIEGKEIVVVGETHQFKMTYQGDTRTSFFR